MDDTAEEIILVLPKVRNGVVTTRDTQFHVDFNFSCEIFLCEYYGNVLVRHTLQRNIMSISVRVDIKQLMNPNYSRRMIIQELREWPLNDLHRQELSKFAFNAAKDHIRLMPPQHNVLVIPFDVLVLCKKNIDENLAMELMNQRLMGEADSRMVPATDSSIESLEIKTTTSHENEESCPICLEDFYAGCEVLAMPCSHFFHEDCIKKWLKSSHYCPICRFEMPTS